jgi:hypothetical protein
MRLAVPPREFAATITARAVLRSGWAVAIAYLAVCFAIVIDLGLSRGGIAELGVPLGALLALLLLLVGVIRRPSGRTGVWFLVGGSAAAFCFDYSLLSIDPELNDHGTFLLNRVTIVLLLIGPVGARLAAGVVWCTAGFLLGSLAMAAAQLSLGAEVRLGWGGVVSLAVYVVVILTFVLIRVTQRRYLPDFSAIELETARMAGYRELEERAVAIVHDTLLGDLTAIANGRDVLEERTRARFARDIEAVSAATVDGAPAAASEAGSADAFRAGLLAIVSEYQWRGLTVDVSGRPGAASGLAEGSAEAVLGAVGACLENVLLHSGASAAEIFVESSERLLSVMVVDHGQGFDPDAVPTDRLGLRGSVVGRIESLGGRVRLWSGPGDGTSVVMTVPLEAGS